MTIKNHPGYPAAKQYMDGTQRRKTAPQKYYMGSKGVCDTGYLGTVLRTPGPSNYPYSCLGNLRNGFAAIGVRVCHGAFGQNLGNTFYLDRNYATPDYAVSSLWNSFDKQDHMTEAYWNWMFDPKTSPWRSLFPNGELELHYIEGRKLPAWLSIKLSPNMSSQLLMSFLMASRIPFEHSDHLVSWYEYYSNGVDPSMAIMLTQYTKTVDFNKETASFKLNTSTYTTYGQYAFDPPLEPSVMLKRMNDATPYVDPSAGVVALNRFYVGVSQIWFNSTYTSVNGRQSMAATNIKDMHKKFLGLFLAETKKKVEKQDSKDLKKTNFFETTKFYLKSVPRSNSGGEVGATTLHLDLNKIQEYVKKVMSDVATSTKAA